MKYIPNTSWILDQEEELRNKILSSISVSKGWYSQQLQPSRAQLVSPEGTLEGIQEDLPFGSHQTTTTLHSESWGNSGYEDTGYSPVELRHISKEWLEWAQTHIFPHIEKRCIALAAILFYFIKSNLLFPLPALCCRTPVYSRSPLASSKQFSRGLLEMLLPGLKVLSGGGGLLTNLYPTPCDPIDCSPPGFSVHVIFHARILEWVAISFYQGSSRPRDWIHVSCIAGSLLLRMSAK